VVDKTLNKWLFRISLIFLAACATAAQSDAQGVRGGGPPVVTVTQVIDLGGAGQKRSFQVQWTTQKPPLTTVLKYDVSLEVKFREGFQTASQKLGAAATSATISFTNVPANARALEFKTIVNTTFTTPESSSVTTTREFDLTTDAVQGGVGSGGALPLDRPVVQIAGAKEIDFNTFEIKWNVQAAPGINIERFATSALVTYQNKAVRPGGDPQFITRQTPVSIATGSQRQTRVIVDNPPPRGNIFPARIRATLDTVFNRPVERTIQSNKEVRF
jgi:hypothetical protein